MMVVRNSIGYQEERGRNLVALSQSREEGGSRPGDKDSVVQVNNGIFQGQYRLVIMEENPHVQ